MVSFLNWSGLPLWSSFLDRPFRFNRLLYKSQNSLQILCHLSHSFGFLESGFQSGKLSFRLVLYTNFQPRSGKKSTVDTHLPASRLTGVFKSGFDAASRSGQADGNLQIRQIKGQ